MSTYYVTGNLNNDGKEYKRGDAIELVDIAAPALIEMGIVQTQPVEPSAPAQVAPVEPEQTQAADVASAGGKPTVSGEPSLDGQEVATGEDTAKEVGPMAPRSATTEPVTPVQKALGSVKGFFARKEADVPKTPEVDPSANL